MKPVEIVSLSADRLFELVRQAVRSEFEDQRRQATSDATGLTLSAAAKLARVRKERVCAAIASGALRGRRVGRKAFRITAAAVGAWVDAGCPTEAP